MSVIERAEQRLAEEERQHELGADNRYDLHYWAAYLDGARAQKKEGGELAMSALNYVERQGFMTGVDYAGMTAEERETLLKELRNLHVGPVAPLVAVHDYAKLVAALRCCSKDKCGQCEYEWNHNRGFCANSMCADAAAAIEALQAEVDTLKRVDYKRCQECLYLGQPVGEQLVEVVRCRECKHRDPETKECDCAGHEMLMGGILPMPDDWFCADGEREVQE